MYPNIILFIHFEMVVLTQDKGIKILKLSFILSPTAFGAWAGWVFYTALGSATFTAYSLIIIPTLTLVLFH